MRNKSFQQMDSHMERKTFTTTSTLYTKLICDGHIPKLKAKTVKTSKRENQ